ncbi:hypothetical protein N7280_00340 [Rickettsia rhipicephali]|nr:hypothetical protein [Rickettsia rhipicephali]
MKYLAKSGVVVWIGLSVIARKLLSNLRSLLLFHEIAAQPTAARNDDF